ncbi:MAG: hypothetical protein ACUVUS_10075 [Thermoproteota archaeon]
MKVVVRSKRGLTMVISLATATILFLLISSAILRTWPLPQTRLFEEGTDESDFDELDDETLPPSLGKSMSILIKDIAQTHKESLLDIRLQRRIVLCATWEERLGILDQIRTELEQHIEEMEQVRKSLSERLEQGEIDEEEYIMEMNRLRLEIRVYLSNLKGVVKEASKALQEDIHEANKEFARRIVEADKRFQQEKKELEKMKEEIKAKVDQLKNKERGSGKK